jgi:hypothetical protein
MIRPDKIAGRKKSSTQIYPTTSARPATRARFGAGAWVRACGPANETTADEV